MPKVKLNVCNIALWPSLSGVPSSGAGAPFERAVQQLGKPALPAPPPAGRAGGTKPAPAGGVGGWGALPSVSLAVCLCCLMKQRGNMHLAGLITALRGFSGCKASCMHILQGRGAVFFLFFSQNVFDFSLIYKGNIFQDSFEIFFLNYI